MRGAGADNVMRDVILYMSMSLDGFVDSDREQPGMAIPEGVELKQWKRDRSGEHLPATARLRRGNWFAAGRCSRWPRAGRVVRELYGQSQRLPSMKVYFQHGIEKGFR